MSALGESPDAGGDPVEVAVEVFSDYTCPWCYVGWARLEAALARLPDDVRAHVRWRAFEIHPEVPQEGMPVESLGYPPDVWRNMQEALARAAEAEGLEVGKRPKVSNTHRALAAGAYAQTEEPEHFAAFHRALFEGYFAEGRDLGDPDVLRQLALRSGVDADAMSAALEEGRYEDELRATSAEARALGITGTPTFVFDRRFAAVGAQPTETLLRAFDSAAREPPPRDGPEPPER